MWSSALFYAGTEAAHCKNRSMRRMQPSAIDALHAASVVYAAQCEVQEGQQVLQNLRQIQRTWVT